MNETKPSASKEEGAIQTDKKDQSRCDESSGSEDPYANYDSDNKNSKRSEVENKKIESDKIKNEESESDISSSDDSQSHQNEEKDKKMTNRRKDEASKSKSETLHSNHDSDNKDSKKPKSENKKKEPNEIKNEESESGISSSDDSQSDAKIKNKLYSNKKRRPNQKEKKEQKRHKKNQEMTITSKDETNKSETETKSESKPETNHILSNYYSDNKDNNRTEVDKKTAEKKTPNEIKIKERESENKSETKSETLSENISRDKNESSKEQKINLRFYVYAPPEFNVDFKTCFFGILHNLGEWKQENIIKLNFRKFGNGFLITGDHSFDVRLKKFEYKYCLLANNDYEVEPFIEYYQGFKKNRILNFANFSPDNFHSIYDGIMLPPDEGNHSSWKKITKSIFPTFVKRFFTDEMSGKYLEDTIKAMLHEIPTINQDDERIKKFKNAKDYMIAIIDSIYKSFKKIKNDDLLKIFSKIYINIMDENQKLTICNSLVFIEYVYRSNIKLNSVEIITIQNIIMNNNCENALEFKNIDIDILEKAIRSDKRFIYFFEIWTKLKLKTDSIENKKYFDKSYFDIIRPFVEHLSLNGKEFFTEIMMMLNYKRSKIIECVLFSFYIINDIIPDERIAEIFSIWEIIGNLCFFTFQIENYRIQTKIFSKISFNQDYQIRLLNILKISFEKFINSLDENNLKSNDNLEFISKACFCFLNNRKLTIFFGKNYSRFSILLTKLYVHKDICYIIQEKKETINQNIRSSLQNLKNFHDNCLILKFYLPETKKTLLNWSLLNEIVEVSNEDIGKIVENLLNEIYFMSFQNIDTSQLVEICSSILKKEIYVHSNVERKIFDEMIVQIDKINQKDLNQFTQFPDHNNHLVQNLIYEVIIKKWPASQNPFGIFNFLFECNNFLRVFLYHNFFQNNKYLETRIIQIISLLEFTFDGLIDGKIEIYLVRLLSENAKTLFELYQLFETRLASKFIDRSNLEIIQNLLKIRFSQIETIVNFLATMNEMLKFFKMLNSKGIKIDYQNFEAKLKYFKDYDSKKVNDLSKCNLDDVNVNLNQIDAKGNLIKRITNFDEIDKIKIEKFKYFIEMSKENTYLLFYIQESINEFQKPVDLKSFLDQILDVALFKFKNLGEDLKTGKLDLRYFSNEIAKIGKNLKIEKENDLYKTELVKAMDHVKMSGKEIEFRLKQLRHFLNLPKIKEISKLLLEIKKKEDLNSNFGPLEKIQESLEESQNQFRYLDDITSPSMKLFESLDKLSDEKFVKCLRKYVEHFKFIEWLRSNASSKLILEFNLI